MLNVRLLDPVDENTAKYQLYKTAYAMTTCTMNEEKIDPDDIEKHTRLIKSLLDKGHTSVLEHINYTFELSNITRALLQELSRHRHTSPTVQSTRWALKKMDGALYHIPEEIEKNEEDAKKYKEAVDTMLSLRKEFTEKYSNDIAKYLTPECVYTKEILTVNARSLINMFELRTSPRALMEFQRLMRKIYEVIPECHKFLYIDFIPKRITSYQ